MNKYNKEITKLNNLKKGESHVYWEGDNMAREIGFRFNKDLEELRDISSKLEELERVTLVQKKMIVSAKPDGHIYQYIAIGI